MNMTTLGFAWESFFRAIQGDLMSLFTVIIIVTVMATFTRWTFKKVMGRREARTYRKLTGGIALALVILLVGIVVFRGVSVASMNRVPQADVDKSGVYQQINSNTNMNQ